MISLAEWHQLNPHTPPHSTRQGAKQKFTLHLIQHLTKHSKHWKFIAGVIGPMFRSILYELYSALAPNKDSFAVNPGIDKYIYY